MATYTGPDTTQMIREVLEGFNRIKAEENRRADAKAAQDSLNAFNTNRLSLLEEEQNWKADSDIIDDILNHVPLDQRPAAGRDALPSMLSKRGEGAIRSLVIKAPEAQIESRKNLVDKYMVGPMLQPVLEGEEEADAVSQLHQAVTHYTEGIGKAKMLGFKEVATAIESNMQNEVKVRTNEMLLESARQAVEYFGPTPGNNALDTGQVNFFKNQIRAGNAAGIMPQLTALIGADVLTSDEERAQLTSMSSTLTTTINAMKDADLVDIEPLLKAQVIVNSKLLGGLKRGGPPPTGAGKLTLGGSFTYKGEPVSRDEIVQELVNAKTNMGKIVDPDDPVSDADILQLVEANPDFTYTSKERDMDKDPIKSVEAKQVPVGSFQKTGIMGSTYKLPKEWQQKLREIGADARGAGVTITVPSEADMKKFIDDADMRGQLPSQRNNPRTGWGLDGPYYDRLLQYAEKLRTIEISAVQAQARKKKASQIQAEINAINDKYDRIKTYRP